jgi:hypothetical protein
LNSFIMGITSSSKLWFATSFPRKSILFPTKTAGTCFFKNIYIYIYIYIIMRCKYNWNTRVTKTTFFFLHWHPRNECKATNRAKDD